MKLVKIPANLKEALVFEADPFSRRVAIIENYLRGAESYLVVGLFLNQAHDSEDWRTDGSEANNFVEWTEKELLIKRSNAQRMMQIWRAVSPYLEKHSGLILQIDFAKLALISPLLGETEDEQEVIDLLHEAKENTVKDLQNNIKARKGEPTTDDCDHIRTEPWEKCLKCGLLRRVKEERSAE